MKKPTVLIAENNSLNRKILNKILSDEYFIVEAENGKDVLRYIKQHNDSLTAVIMDFLMPGMNCDEILYELSNNESCSDIPILVATDENDPKIEHLCLSLGAWDFVTKPYDAKIIKIRLQNIIGRRKSNLLERIRYISQRDNLTELYNREYFFEKTKNMLAEHHDTVFVLVRVDMNRFRLFNASFGKEAGDKLLKSFAEAIRRDAQDIEVCTYGRIESDVFCLCVPYRHEMLIKKIQNSSMSVQTLSIEYHLDLSFGIYIITQPYQNLEEAYSYASEAAKKCKETVDLLYVFYDDNMHKKQTHEHRISNDAQSAIEQNQFKVYLQPKYSLATNKPCGAEALVRWIHPKYGLISPNDFIPLFEKNGFIKKLDYYMWENVCKLIHKWLSAGDKVYPISVNVSRISLYDPNIVDNLSELTSRYEVPHELLNLEITESAYMSNPERMKSLIANLRTNGFVILMDDFGSGYSSLNTLKEIDMDILKIDMRFLPSGEKHTKCEKILAAITRMAAWLGMPVIVEGVETKEQTDFLISIGCEFVQGYFFSRPMPVDDYEKFIRKNNSNILETALKTDMSDFDMIWSSDAQTGGILKTISVPFAIMEYSVNRIATIRMNSEFMHIFGTETNPKATPDKKGLKMANEAFREAALINDKSECECMFAFSDGSFKWFQINIRKICTVMNGTLLSATFTDITMQQAQQLELNKALAALKLPSTKKISLLIIGSDSIALCDLFNNDYTVIPAESGKDGLRLLRENSDTISAVLLNLQLSDMTNYDFILNKNEIAEAADIPVVVISADNTESAQTNMIQFGVYDYITDPYAAAAVVRRIKNVIEYSNRFRTLIKEYNDTILIEGSRRTNVKNEYYNTRDINGMIDFMNKIFDVVRVVDPIKMEILEFDDTAKVSRKSYACYKVWGKEHRCDNCSSLCASNQHCMLSKYEFIENNIFYVISQPIRVVISDKESLECVLEVVSHVSDHIMAKKPNSQSVEQLIEETKSKIYRDSLTGAYNRRYYNEMLFLTGNKIALIVLDIYKFKQVNDLYGHSEGDRILIEVTKQLNSAVKKTDAVIRYGGDEFVVIINGCEKEEINKIIQKLRDSVSEVHYGKNSEIATTADFGYDYTTSFFRDSAFLNSMFVNADKMMYGNKRVSAERELNPNSTK